MGLSLNASKKNIQTLFDSGELQYVIPYFQRPYSWEYAQVNQLYEDIVYAYNHDGSYFLGNILLAISENEASNPQVVDGQQRLITIWLMLKVMSTLLPEHANLSRLVSSESLFSTNEQPQLRIGYQLKEFGDNSEMHKVSLWYRSDMEILWDRYAKNNKISERLCPQLIEANCLYMYSWISEYTNDFGEAGLLKLMKFLLDSVYMLPIEMTGQNSDEAMTRALKIYESMNNRGLSLADADIFKARLYNKASKNHEEQQFIEQWMELSSDCDELSISIDEVFRYYMHILRGEKNIVTGETSLRDFFIAGSNPPLDLKDYSTVMMDLSRIISILRKYKMVLNSDEDIAKWLRVIDWYTNQYPKIALVAYIYHHGNDCFDNKGFLRLAKAVIRYCYSVGSSTVVKFEMYNIIRQVSQDIEFSDYFDTSVSVEDFDYLGALKKGFSLLTYVIRHSDVKTSEFMCDRLFKGAEAEYMMNFWSEYEVESAIGSIANYYIRRKDGSNWVIDEMVIKDYMSSKPNIEYKDFKAYSIELKQSLVDFYIGK